MIGLVHRDIPDRYALGVCFLQGRHHGRAFAMLSQSGWDLEWDELSVLQRGSNTLRRDIDIALAKVLAAAVKKSEPAAV